MFDEIRDYFEKSNPDNTIYIFVPYIKTTVLEKLLDGLPNPKVIVTTWKPRDILFGSSELELYPYCRDQKITLYLSPNIHLKVYSVELEDAIIATGNVSNRGLLPNGNYEVGANIESLDNDDRLVFGKILHEARLVDDVMYDKLTEWYENNKVEADKYPSLEDIVPLPEKDDFSVAALPMTRSVDELVSGYLRIVAGKRPSEDSEIVACVFHDIANYDISKGLSESEFIAELTRSFFAHPFIQRIDEFIAPEAYFGRIKEWIQDNCTDVPVPSRRELTGNVQVLLEWFERLGDGKYKIDVPGRHSQRIKKL